MPSMFFDCILGGVVPLDCEVTVRFGKVDPHSLRVTHLGMPFDCDGIIIDYEGEFLPMSSYLVGHAQKNYKEEKHGDTKSK